MQKFNKKQIALAVSASLAAMASLDANALALKSGTGVQPILASKNNALEALYKATGISAQTAAATSKVNIQVSFANAIYDTVKFAWNDSTAAGTANSAADLLITYGTAGTMLPAKNIISVSRTNAAGDSVAALVNGDALDSTASISGLTIAVGVDSTFSLGALGSLRINNATGNLQYLDSAGVGGDITVKFQQNTDTATQSNGLIDSNGSTLSAGAISSATIKTTTTLALDIEAKTRADSAFINGLVVDFRHPLAATPAATDIVLRPVSSGADTSISNNTTNITVSAVTLGNAFVVDTTNLDSTGVPYASTAQQTSIDITANMSAATAFGSSWGGVAYKGWNTGLANANVPYSIAAYDTSAALTGKAIKYANIYDSATGKQAQYDSVTMDPLGAAGTTLDGLAAATKLKDGAAAIVTKAEYDAIDTPNTKGVLTVTFSEALNTAFIANAAGADDGTADDDDEREVLNNITAGGASLAALAFNRNLTVAMELDSNVLTLSSAPADAGVGAALVVNKRITVADPGDANYVATRDTIGSAGIRADSTGASLPTGVTFEALTGSYTVAKFQKASTMAKAACGGYTAGDATKIAKIVCTFPSSVTKTSAANLTDKIRVAVYDSGVTPYADAGGGDTASNFFTLTIDSNVSVSGTNLTVDLPTALKTKNTSTMTLTLLDSTQLVDTAGQAIGKDTVSVTLPYFADPTNQMLYTMDAKGAVTGATNGDRITAYLAKWLDGSTGVSSVSLTNGRITDAGDKVATDILLSFNNTGDSNRADTQGLADLIKTELTKDKPGLVTAYVNMIRTNDVTATGAGGAATQNANLKWAWAQITAEGDHTADAIDQKDTHTSYVVQVDPKTGNISGRLNGNIGIKVTPKAKAGLAFIQTDGSLVTASAGTVGTSPATAKAMVTDTAGAFNLFIGADTKDAKVFDNAFVLAVLEKKDSNGVDSFKLITSGDSAADNYVQFTPSLLAKNMTKDSAGTLVLNGAKLGDVGRVKVPTIDLDLLKKTTLASSTAWQLVGVGNAARMKKAIDVKAVRGQMIALDSAASNSFPTSIWTDSANGDMMLTMQGNATGVAAEGSTGATVSNINPDVNMKANAAAFALMNDISGNTATKGMSLYFLQKAAAEPKLPAGWSLIAWPKAWTGTASVSSLGMLLKVGAQAGTDNQVSWVAGDTAKTVAAGELTVGEPVFVYLKAPTTTGL